MNEEVRKAVRSLYADESDNEAWLVVCNELTRLTEIADSVDPLVARLEAANALLRSCNAACKRIIEQDGGILGGINFNALGASITAHLSEPRT